MSLTIERWFTPWIEEIIVAAENALATTAQPTESGQLVVHTIHKKIGKVKKVKKDWVDVFIRTQVGGHPIWVEEIWNIKNARFVKRCS